jgi:hypothetical protein
VIDHRGVTLSAGIAAFDKTMVERFKDFTAEAPADVEQIEFDPFDEDGHGQSLGCIVLGPVSDLAQPPRQQQCARSMRPSWTSILAAR